MSSDEGKLEDELNLAFPLTSFNLPSVVTRLEMEMTPDPIDVLVKGRSDSPAIVPTTE